METSTSTSTSPSSSNNIRLYLIRHGQSVANLTADTHITGQSNHSPLTPEGELQAQRLGRHLAKQGIRFSRVFSSTAVRAKETARLVLQELQLLSSEDLSLSIHSSEELLEVDMGDWVGLERSVIYTPERKAMINSDPWNFAPPNGESPRRVEERMLNFIQSQILNYSSVSSCSSSFGDEHVVAIFGHGFAIKCLLRWVQHLGHNETRFIPVENTSMTELHISFSSSEKAEDRGEGSWRWRVVKINDITHL